MASTSNVSTGIVSSTTVSTNDTLNIYNNGIASGTTISANGNVSVYSGGIINNTIMYDNAGLTIVNGGSAFNTDIKAGHLYALSGSTNYIENTTATYATISVADGQIVSTTLYEGGTLFVSDKGIARDTIINNNTDLGLGISNNGSAYGTIINSGGTMEVASGGHTYDTTIYGSATVLNNGNIYDNTIGNGGVLTISTGGNLSGTTTINNGGSAVIWYGAGGSAQLLNHNNGQLVITGLTGGQNPTTVINITTTIDSFSGEKPGNSDAIILEGINQEDVVNVAYEDATGKHSSDHVTLTLKDGSKITMNIIGAENAGYNLSSRDGQLVYEVCFLTGSLIKTIHGDIKVEELRVGDELVTYDWKNSKKAIQKIKWIGYKNAIVNPNLSDDIAGYPVRILKDAIAENVPYKDLLTTPEHCLFFDGKFIPTRMLVNNYNIFYDYSITDYIYYHVETETHSVIWADGMLTESYLDTGNRQTFHNSRGNVILFSQEKIVKNWGKDGCAPLLTDRNSVEPLFNDLVARAQNLGLSKRINDLVLDNDPQLYITTKNGKTIHPHAQNNDRFLFAIPSDTDNIRLISQNSRPSDTIGAFVDDRRELGVLIGNITLLSQNSMKTIDTHLSQNDLDGWQGIESHLYRWTNGNADLPLGLHDNKNSQEVHYNILVVHVVAGGPYLSLTQEIKKVA
ncbi:Large exoprotein involved in heme utilization or adhesion (FhaB) (PDB:4RM6) [Commensalibacter communis]|uniref:Hint domain-containing protein n=1 Tax=Commensalibacter communis TaxID=2972786 RepID=UPI0022FF8A05|nr:Hint domain-containing protein [Commensalibacter communis]CAI3922629.1 Large exoprotein involved in heme utilization or adhesion (FhaB) (PDB:4RM6) [Commensalibacter communis]CAI3936718.1 Large exoprotein involved in heme utilization or adhesion (FhaB) (PDB:4RM6) [Commensalibacter communis]